MQIDSHCIREANVPRLMIMLITAALIAAVWIGLKIPCQTGLAVTAQSPVKDNLFGGAAKLFLPELAAAAILSFGRKSKFAFAAAASVFAIRGLAIGHAVCFCTVNSANAETVGALAAFCAATLMLAAYAIFLTNVKDKSNPAFGLLCYLAVSGGACILKAVPYLFL